MTPREIDRQIAEKVFKIKSVKRWKCIGSHLYKTMTGFLTEKDAQNEVDKWPRLYAGIDSYTPPRKKPSTNIAHAFEVVEKMMERSFPSFELEYIQGGYKNLWFAAFDEGLGQEANTPAMAICLAALEAVKGAKDG